MGTPVTMHQHCTLVVSAHARPGEHRLGIKLKKTSAEAFSAQLSRGTSSHMEEGNAALKTRQERFTKTSKSLYLCTFYILSFHHSFYQLKYNPGTHAPSLKYRACPLSISIHNSFLPTAAQLTGPSKTEHNLTLSMPRVERSHRQLT